MSSSRFKTSFLALFAVLLGVLGISAEYTSSQVRAPLAISEASAPADNNLCVPEQKSKDRIYFVTCGGFF